MLGDAAAYLEAERAGVLHDAGLTENYRGTNMVKIDEKRMAERPEGVTEAQWRAKLAYEAVQQGQKPEDATATDDTAKQAADDVMRKARRVRS